MTTAQTPGLYTATPINNYDTTTARPAVCNFNGEMYVFWHTATPGEEQIFMSKSNSDHLSWPNGNAIVQKNALSAPAVTVFKGSIHLFWIAKSDVFPETNSVWSINSNNGTNWSAPEEFSAIHYCLPNQPPAVCTWHIQGKDYLVLATVDKFSRSGISFRPDGKFPGSATESGHTNVAPCVYVFQDELIQLTVDLGSTNNITYRKWTATNVNPTQPEHINDKDSTIASPAAMAWSPHRMLITWRAHDDSGSIFQTVGPSFPIPNGGAVGIQTGIAQSKYAPALCNLSDTNTYLFYTGKDDNKIYFIQHFDE